MIFSTSLRQQFVYHGILTGFTTTHGITVYSGVQPAAADIIQNWDAFNSSNPNFLCHFSGCGWSQPQQNILLQLSTFPAATPATNSGTGTWAILWSNTPTDIQLADTVIPTTSFIVVPVTDIYGTGVIRFEDTTFTMGVTKTIGDGSIGVLS